MLQIHRCASWNASPQTSQTDRLYSKKQPFYSSIRDGSHPSCCYHNNMRPLLPSCCTHFLVFFFKEKKYNKLKEKQRGSGPETLELAPGTASTNGSVFWFYFEEMRISYAFNAVFVKCPTEEKITLIKHRSYAGKPLNGFNVMFWLGCFETLWLASKSMGSIVVTTHAASHT